MALFTFCASFFNICAFLLLVHFAQALECLVRLASIRRSLFPNDEARSKFLAHLMSGTKEILQTGQGFIIRQLISASCIYLLSYCIHLQPHFYT